MEGGQKDRNAKIETNQPERVNVNKVESVGHDKASEIGKNMLQVFDGNLSIRVGPGNTGTVTPSGAARLPEGLPTVAETFGQVASNAGDGDLLMSIERHKIQTIGDNHDETVGITKTTTAGKDIIMAAEAKIEIVAGDLITLKCGQSQMTLNDNGTITMNGKTLNATLDKLIHMLADQVKIN